MNPKKCCLRAVVLITLLMHCRAIPWLTCVGAQDNSPSQARPIKTKQLQIQAQNAPVYALQYALETPYMEQRPGNAALLYDTALTLLAKTKGKYPDFNEEVLIQWIGGDLEGLPLDRVRNQLSWFDRVFHYLDLASQAEQCRWEPPVREEGFHSEMPDLASFRTLARLLVLKARLALVDGDIDTTLQTIRIGITMGRQVGQGPFVVQNYVGVSLVHRMVLEIERLIQTADTPNLYWALTALPHPLVDMRRALQMERDAMYTELPELRRLDREVLSDDEVIDVWNRALALSELADDRPHKWATRLDMVTHAMKAYPQAKQFLQEQGQTTEEVDALPALYVVLRYQHHHYRQLRDSIYKWYHLPYWQAKEGLKPAYHYRERQSDVVIKALLDTIPGDLIYFFNARLEREIAMLRCVEAIRLYAAENGGRLPPSLNDIHQVPIPLNPMTGRMFHYQVANNKATLESPASEGRLSDGFRYEITITPLN